MGAFDAERVALLSIRPEFAGAIFSGRKTVEFRRSRLPDDITTVVVYATQPVGLVLGWFTIAGVSEGTPEALWRRFRSSGAIDRRPYFQYFAGARRAFGIEIDEPRPLKRPLTLKELLPGLRAPQGFHYLVADEVRCAIEAREPSRRTRARLKVALAT
jgi:predicted transcriptional regulator